MGDPGMSVTSNDGPGWYGAVPAPDRDVRKRGSCRKWQHLRAVPSSEVTVAGAAISDGAYTLFVADFSDTDTAWSAYQELKSLEDGATVEVDGVIVVKRDADGVLEVQEATDHSTRTGLTWGVVGGVVLGVIFPPSILGSAAVLGAAGAAGGKLRQRHHRKELAERLETAIAPGALRARRAGLRSGRRAHPKGPESGQFHCRIRGR